MRTNSFNMPKLRKRAKKMMRAKYKKTIKLTDLDKVWQQYFTYGILNPLLKYGRVQIDRNFTIEIVGTPLEKSIAYPLLCAGKNVNGIMKDAVKFAPNRQGVIYGIRVTDKNYKGKLIFEADKELKKSVHKQLTDTQTYYRIQQR